MSQFYDSASLVLVPSGYKSQKIYAQKPLTADGQLTFSRSSEASRIGPDGLIEKVHTNELLQSNSFDTTWFNSNSTETSGQSGYDGSSDAWRIDITGAAGYISQSIAKSGVATASVYAKAGTLNFVRFRITGSGANKLIDVDLTDGSIDTTDSGNIDATSTSVGNGWYRITLTFDSVTSAVLIYPIQAAGDFTATSGNILIQDAQLESGLVATDYIETTTAAVSVGPVADLPRLSYDPANPTCPSLILEPQRTQLIPQSEFFGSYTLVNVTATANATTSPEGVSNAYKITEDSANTNKHFRAANTTLAASTYSVSIFIKPDNCDVIALREGLVSGDAITYKFSTGTSSLQGTRWGATSLNVEQYAGGWYRVSANFTATSATSHNFRIHLLGNDFNQTTNPNVGTYTYLGDGTSGVFAYGMQCELGSFVSSYIPSYGAATTRGADSASKTGISSLIGQTEGTIFFDFTLNEYDTSSIFVMSTIGGAYADFGFAYYSGTFTVSVYNTTLQAELTATDMNDSGVYKVGFAYANNDFVLYVNGVQKAVDTSGTPPAASTFNIHPSGLYDGNWGINQTLLFKTRLTNAQLAELTAL